MNSKNSHFLAAVLAILTQWGSGPARAIINPRFTPTDLVRGSARIFQVELTAPAEDATSLSGKITATLRGEAPADPAITFNLAEAQELSVEAVAAAFGPNRNATAILLLSEAPAEAGDEPAGALQINTLWYAVHRLGDGWRLESDRQDLFAVWAGTSRMLIEGVRYVLNDPAASFPVQSDIVWRSDMSLGDAGTVRGCMPADFGGVIGPGVVAFGPDGDRLFKLGESGAAPSNITQKARLNTASHVGVPGDFDGDGRLDLAGWDGKCLLIAAQMATGVFEIRTATAALKQCLSLDVVEAGGAGLLAGTPEAPALLVPDGKGAFTVKFLTTESEPEPFKDLGAGGYCTAADFDGDGRCDVMQLFEGGTMLYRGQAGGFGPGAKTRTRLVRNPRLAICGDYDADGKLDLIVGGDDGLALLSHGESPRLANNTYATGELDYHGNMNRRRVTCGSPADVNNDGRQGAAVFYAEGLPLVFFNRGFACFGLARELQLVGGGGAGEMMMPGDAPKAELKAAAALQNGQASGLVWDLNGDSVQDMLAVDPQGRTWALFGDGGGRRMLGLTILSPSAARGPLTVTVSDSRHRLGMHVLRPGVPVFVGRPFPGPVTLEWKNAEGQPQTKKVVVMKSLRVEL